MVDHVVFVKHLGNQPVGMRTHQLSSTTGIWAQMLFNASDVIGASTGDANRRLLGLPEDFGPLTLHAVVDGVESFIPGNLLFSSIPAASCLFNNPLIIKSQNDTITMDEYMVSQLPLAVYENPLSRPNSSGSNWKKPSHVLLWSSFETDVTNWLEANHLQHSQRIQKPVFVNGIVITDEVQTLQPFIKLNLLDVSSKCFIPPSEFKARRQIVSCIGEPDHVMTRGGEIVAIAEEKGKWTLTSGDLVTIYASNSYVSKALNQLYHYMRLNYCKYGILSSYEFTWFVCRVQVCDICQDPPRHETLVVSNGFAYNCQNPPPLQCLAYFNTIVDATNMDSPPSSQRSSRSSSAQVNESVTSVFSPRGSRGNLFQESGSPSAASTSSSHQQIFDADDFRFNAVMGEGRSKVYLEQFDSKPVALKVADVAKNAEMLVELQNEVAIYEDLAELQGYGIPKFLCHGFIEEVLYCVGVSVCGNVVETLDSYQKQALVLTLEKIHQAGILHNDIKMENILVDESGNPFIIDFGFASRNVSADARAEERNLLLTLIEAI
ncbi:hypothetical protein BDR26DRAFT_862600 [Obelidium mucronatum]|nr:hypothetical protein BDR26DRAFT_862600 [Obelidium mucronatum]